MILGIIGFGLAALAVLRLQEQHSDPPGRAMAAGAAVLLVLSVWPLAGKALQGEPLLWLIVVFGAAVAALMGRWALNR